MLVLRYFGYVGGALLALLLVCAAMLPKPPASDSTVASAAEGPVIRIHSERKWPERIVLDTNAPMPAPPVGVAEGLAQPVPAEPAANARTSEALAQLPPEQPPKRVAQSRKPEPRVVRRRIARARFAPSPYAYAYAPSYYGYGRSPRTMQVAQQPHFGFFW